MPFHKNEAIRSRLVERFSALNLANGRPPTVRELAKDLGVAHSTAGYHINILAGRGTLRRAPGTRNLSLAPIDYDAIFAADDGLSLMRHLVAAHQGLKPEDEMVYPADTVWNDLEPVTFPAQRSLLDDFPFSWGAPGVGYPEERAPISTDDAVTLLEYLLEGHDGD